MVRSRVVEALLSSVLGDPHCIGSATVFRDHPSTTLGGTPLGVIVDVVSAKHHDCVSPGIELEVEELVHRCEGDILRLLETWVRDPRSLCRDVSGVNESRFPTSAFRGGSAEPSPRRLGFHVADSHLHSGATMPVNFFLRTLASRTSAIPFSGSLTRVSSTGGVWDMEPVLAALRLALRLQGLVALGGPPELGDLFEDGFRSDALEEILEGSFWTSAAEAARATAPSAPGKVVHPFITATNGAFRTSLTAPDMATMVWPPASGWLSPVPDQHAFLLGLCRGIAMISGAVASADGEGLTQFARRFAQWSELRKLAVGGDTSGTGRGLERDHLALTLPAIAPSDEVVAAELRKSFRGADARALRVEILAALGDHYTSFATFSESRTIDLTMPVSFLREPQADRSPASAGLVELAAVLAGVDALRRLRNRPGGEKLIDAIGAFDVVNDEVGSTNWAFSVGAQLLARHLPELAFSIHAGENFTSHLNGLRRVGELFLKGDPPSRIGHALSLSTATADRILAADVTMTSLADALMDLCWVASCSAGHRQEALAAIQVLVGRTPGRKVIDASVWVKAFEDLHDLVKVEEVMLRSRGDGYLSLIPLEERNSLYLAAGRKRRAMLTLAGAVDGAVAEVDLGQVLAGHSLEVYEEVSNRAVPHLRQQLVEQCARSSIVEHCPTSNVRLAGLTEGHRSHPFGDADLAALRRTISSDDPAIFGTTVLDEVGRLLDSGHDEVAVRAAALLSVQTCASGVEKRPRGPDWYRSIAESCGSRSAHLSR